MKAMSLCALIAALWAFFPAGASALDAEPWGRVLGRHVRNGRMDYAELVKDESSRRDLAVFLRGIVKMSEDEPLASWLNAYNALVVMSVVERYPVGSVRDISGFFDGAKHRVAGMARTLDEIERSVLRERFKDSRVHAAICHGAVSSPPLLNEPFRTETLDATLTRLAQQFVANERNVRIEGHRLAISSVFFWSDDFARDARSLVGWLKKYAVGRLATVRDDVVLIETNYDWSLNGPT
jgi:hypothetical protein